MENKNYKRILLKLSGESIMGSQPFGIDFEACQKTANAIKGMHDSNLEVAIVIGGGNIFRGINLKNTGVERSQADNMGLLATLINGTALQDALNAVGCKAVLMTALECPKVAETYTWRRAMELMAQGTVVIFVGGTGNPYFTTDTAAALRANEIHADVILKATKVDGVYNKDPFKYQDAVKYDEISYSQILAEKLEVMDATAIALCMITHIPVFVFNMKMLYTTSVNEILNNKKNGTVVS